MVTAELDEVDYAIHLLKEDACRNTPVDIANHLQSEATEVEELAFPFRELFDTVRSFEDAIVMQFPIGVKGGVVELEPEVTRELTPSREVVSNAFRNNFIQNLAQCFHRFPVCLYGMG